MMFEFDEPEPTLLLDGKSTLPMHAYLLEIVMSQPYWRASAEALEQAEEVLDQIDLVAFEKTKTYTVSKSSFDALREQMKLSGTGVVAQNANLVRPSIRFGRHVQAARKIKE